MHTVLRARGPTTRNLIRVAGKLQWPPGDKAPSSKRFLPPPRPPSARLCGHPSLSQICLTVRQEVSPVAARLSPPVIPGTARTYGFQVGTRKIKKWIGLGGNQDPKPCLVRQKKPTLAPGWRGSAMRANGTRLSPRSGQNTNGPAATTHCQVRGIPLAAPPPHRGDR